MTECCGNDASCQHAPIRLGCVAWAPHHSWGESAERVDGQLTISGQVRQLDIASLADECCLSEDEPEAAEAAWVAGRVLAAQTEKHGVTTLVVPFPSLTTELIHEALRRFMP